MAAQQAKTVDTREDTPRRNWFHLTKGWKRHEAWRTLTPSYRIIFYTILDIANELWFPDTITLYEAEIADESVTSTRSVKRALEELRDAGVLHFGTVEEDKDRRTAVRIRIDYEALSRLGSRQCAKSAPAKSAVCRHDDAGTQRPPTSSPTQVQLQNQHKDCPGGQLRVSEVGGGLREGDLCPKCKTHRLATRFKTDTASRTKQRFLACSGHSTGGCRGFTWNLGSTAYTPSQRILAQALVGAQDVPGRPPLVGARRAVARSAQDDALAGEDRSLPTDMADLFARFRYVPVDQLLGQLAHVDADLAAYHRTQGSEKSDVLRDVKARMTSGTIAPTGR
jgi:hypothetical protein